MLEGVQYARIFIYGPGCRVALFHEFNAVVNNKLSTAYLLTGHQFLRASSAIFLPLKSGFAIVTN